MTYQFVACESFSHYSGTSTHGKWDDINTDLFVIEAASGRRGGGAIHFTKTPETVGGLGITKAVANLVLYLDNFGFAFNFAAWPTGANVRMAAIGNVGTSTYFEVNPTTHCLEVWGFGGTVLVWGLQGTSSPLNLGTWYHVGYWHNNQGVGGNYPSALQIDNSLVFSIDGSANGRQQGPTTFTSFLPGGINHASTHPTTYEYYVADMYYIASSDTGTIPFFAGDQPVECLRPMGQGFYSEWDGAGTSSPHYAAVNEVLFGDNALYVASATDGQRDTYQMSDLVAASGSIYGLQLVAALSGSGGGTVAPLLRLSSVNNQGIAITPGGSPAYSVTPYPFNVFTSPGVLWDASIVNALEAGLTHVVNGSVQADQLLIEVVGLAQPVVQAIQRSRIVVIGGST